MQLSCQTAFLTLATANLERLVTFYRRLFGQAPSREIPNRYAEFHLPNLRLGLFCPQAQHQHEFNSPQGAAFSLCLEVESLDAAIAHVKATYHALEQQGQWSGPLPLGNMMTPSHGREIYVYDPDGNRLILHEAIAPQSAATSTAIDDSLAP